MEMSVVELRALWTGVGQHLWQCTLVLVVLFAVSLLLSRAAARSVRLLWAAGLLKLFLPLAALGPLGATLLRWPAASADAESTTALGAVLAPALFVAGVRDGETAYLHESLFYLTVLWLSGSAWLIAAWLMRAFRARTRRGRTTAPDARLAAALAGTSIPARDVVLDDAPAGPRVDGLVCGRIVIPRMLLDQLDTEELRAILLHENAHRRRRDPLLAMFARLAFVAFYFYPPLWLVLRRLGAATENACDEEVLASGIARGTYAQALARVVSLCSMPEAGVLAAAGTSPLRQRFERIADPRRRVTMLRHKLLLTASIAVVFAASFLPLVPAGQAGAVSGDLSFVELERLRDKDLTVVLQFDEVQPEKIFRALASAAGFDLRIEGQLDHAPMSIRSGEIGLARALREIAARAGVRYRVPDPATLIVIAPEVASKAGRAQLDPEPLVLGKEGSERVSLPTRIEAVQPIYPPRAREEQVEGRVILQAVIGVDGSLSDIQVLRAEPRGMGFEEASIDAARRWRYEPATRDGEPVAVYFSIVMNFELPDENPPDPESAAD